MSRTVQALREAGVTCISCFLLAAQASKAEESAPGSGVGHSAVGPIEEVLVTGEHPGPGLWKVTRGTHVLWILGVRSPLPKDLVWRQDPRSATLVEAVHDLGVNLCVDGVETAEQAKWWTEAGADLAIGAHVGSPLDAGEFLKKLKD